MTHSCHQLRLLRFCFRSFFFLFFWLCVSQFVCNFEHIFVCWVFFFRSFVLSLSLALSGWCVIYARHEIFEFLFLYQLSTCCSCHLYSAFLQFVCRCSRSANASSLLLLLLKSCCLFLWKNWNKFFFLNHPCSFFVVSLSGFFERALFQFFCCLLFCEVLSSSSSFFFFWRFCAFFVTALIVEGIRVCLFVCSFFVLLLFFSLCVEGFVEAAWDGSSFFLFFSRADCLWRTSSWSEYCYGALFLSVPLSVQELQKKCSPRSAEECRKQGRIGSYQAADDDDDVCVFSDANPLS